MGDRVTAEAFYRQAADTVADKSRPEFLAHSYQLFSSAMYADPTYAQAAYQAGNNASDLNHLHAAVACWRRALECEMPDRTPPGSLDVSRAKVLSNLGWRLEMLGGTQEAFRLLKQATEIDPELAFAWLNLGIVQGRTGDTKSAVVSVKKAQRLLPNDSTVEMGLAFALLFDRQLAEGFKRFESRYDARLPNFTRYPYPKWHGETGKTIFVVSDQGLGDTISMARFLRETCKRATYVHACVAPPLLRLLQYALNDIPNLNLLPQPTQFPAADAWTTFVSLPFALGLTDDEIRNTPQIEYDAPRTNPKQWRVADRKFHIGIAWRGSELNEINEYRSIPITQFLDLYRVPGVQLYSLQVDDNKKQLNETGCAPLIKDLSGYIRDVADTMSFLKDLDLVITIESALGHICTLAKKETWVPYCYLGKDFRVGIDGTDQVWSNYNVFCQDNTRQWQFVFDGIVEALEQRCR